MAAHSSLGASSAERWWACPGSVELSKGLPDTASEYAHEGTCAHYLGELCLTKEVHPKKYLDKTLELPEGDRTPGLPDTFKVTREMVDNVATYTDFARNLGGDLYVEQRLDYSRWVPGGFGTGDTLAYVHETQTLHVADLKYGQGVKVYAVDLDGSENKQLMLYGLGAYALLELLGMPVLKVELHIIQPRLDHISSVEVTMPRLLEFGKEARERALMTQDPDAELNPSPKACQWCKVKDSEFGCSAFDEYVKDEALQGFDFLSEDLDEDPKEYADSVPLSRLEKIIMNEPLVTKMMKQARERAEQKILEGEAVKGLKLVAGRGSTRYTEDDDAMIVKLKAIKHISAKSVVTVKPITAAKARDRKDISDRWKKMFIEKVEGKPTVAHESDKRPALSPAADALDGFGVIEE